MATQPALHSSAEELVKMLGIVVIIRIFNSAVRIDRPIAACLAPTAAHDETVSRFKPGDPLVEGLSIGDDGSAQEFGDHRFIGTARGRMVFEQWRKFGCPAKGCPMKTIIERFQAQNIACAEELLTSAVPDYQCKVAEKVFRTMLSPMLIGAEHQLCICIGAEVEACGIQREGEVFPIVDPPVICEAKSSCFVRPGLPFIERFRSRVEHDVAAGIVNSWVQVGDFLLTEHEAACADFVVGNPPYIRLEGVPTELTDAYRRACPTMRGRSDIYVGFFEVGLDLLRPGGALAFICADRWMHNQYGASLREFVTSKFAVDAIVTMHDVAAFENDVSAYPAITVLRNDNQRVAHVVDASREFGEEDACVISSWINGSSQRRTPSSRNFQASRVDTWHKGPELWPAGSPSQLALLADLERRFAPLESRATGTRVGIGVATGCDDVYITRRSDLVEEDRLLPLLRASDLTNGEPAWSGHYLVNPWEGRELVDLAAHPRLRRHFEAHSARLRIRHTAKKRPDRWYRTIDAIDPTLLARPKIVLPDMKAAAHPVLDRGEFYPHHNLYFVVSDGWDLEVLGGILLSDVANLFVGAYCVKMRGGCYRFQAQYIRQIRVPEPDQVPSDIARSLVDAFRRRDRVAATNAAAALYGIEVGALGIRPAA